MKRFLMIAVTAAALLNQAGPAAEQVKGTNNQVVVGQAIGMQPDTTSPNWKALSDDVGMMLRDDDRLGLRGRLYVRFKGQWRPVALDGLADMQGLVPVR
jgi:opacity protein-like surface antigen